MKDFTVEEAFNKVKTKVLFELDENEKATTITGMVGLPDAFIDGKREELMRILLTSRNAKDQIERVMKISNSLEEFIAMNIVLNDGRERLNELADKLPSMFNED
jgi:hypothetical protein